MPLYRATQLPKAYMSGFAPFVENGLKVDAPGLCRDWNDTFDIEDTGISSLGIDLTASGAGGLDTGAVAADTWYYVYVIADSTGINPVDAMASLSTFNPTLPAGYDKFRRAGTARTYPASTSPMEMYTTSPGLGGFDANRQYPVGQRMVQWAVSQSILQVLTAGAATSATPVDISDRVPPGSGWALLDVRTSSQGTTLTGAGSSSEFYVQADQQMLLWVFADRVGGTWRIEYENDAGGGSTDIFVHGYLDFPTAAA